MKTIDCRICKNCDMEKDRCKVYGSDPKAAVEACAAKHFGAYRPNCGAMMGLEETNDQK